jgi:G:T-mismatch repair DNA endonuclease (very short patch repair protein)
MSAHEVVQNAYKTAQMAAVNEKELLQQVIDAASLLHLLAYHAHDSRRSAAGFPDVVIAGRTGVLYVELKTKHGRPTREQKTWLDALKTAGAEVWLVRPDGLYALVDRMKRLGRAY